MKRARRPSKTSCVTWPASSSTDPRGGSATCWASSSAAIRRARELASWLRDDVAPKADAAEASARWARNQLGEDGTWWDVAAELTWINSMREPARQRRTRTRSAGSPRESIETADQLAYARELLAEVPREAEFGMLEHTDEYVRPPAPSDDLGHIYEGDPAALTPDVRAQIFNERQRH